MLFVDLDRFKEINDNLGHEVGDQLLVEIAERLLVVTGGQHTVSRFGGDEFTILIDKLGSQAVAIELTQHLKDAIAVPFDLEGTHVVIGASIGIAIGPDDASVAAERMLHDGALRKKIEERGMQTSRGRFGWPGLGRQLSSYYSQHFQPAKNCHEHN